MFTGLAGAALLILGCLALGSWIRWMTLDNESPYDWEGSPASFMTPDPAPQGGFVTANWKLTKVNRLCPATLQRSFRNHETGELVATLDTKEASRAVKFGDVRLPRSFQLPSNLPAYDYGTLVCFECNPYQGSFLRSASRRRRSRFASSNSPNTTKGN